jgi:acyl carrier protein
VIYFSDAIGADNPGLRFVNRLERRYDGSAGDGRNRYVTSAGTSIGVHYMADLTELELEVAHTIVDALNLEDVRAENIDPEEPLFRDGLGLDSIDALEIALAISMKYGFQIRSDDDDNSRIFASLRALSHHVEENRVK